VNNFQKYLSYLYRITVLKTSSHINPILIVAIQNGKYVLNAKNANYSFGSLHRVFQQTFRLIAIKDKNIKETLLLGCGAGSVVSIIFNELHLATKIDTVELDSKVIEIGKKYFNLNAYKNLTIFNTDALDFLQKSTKTYDLIIIDVFQNINVPAEFQTQQFFNQVKSRLNDKGIVLFNFVAYNYETKQKSKAILTITKKVFSSSKVFKIENINRVFYSKK